MVKNSKAKQGCQAQWIDNFRNVSFLNYLYRQLQTAVMSCLTFWKLLLAAGFNEFRAFEKGIEVSKEEFSFPFFESLQVAFYLLSRAYKRTTTFERCQPQRQREITTFALTFSLFTALTAHFVPVALLIASLTTPKLPCPRTFPNS